MLLIRINLQITSSHVAIWKVYICQSVVNFQNYHLVEFLPTLTNLNYVDITHCSLIDYSSVYELLNVMVNIKMFYFDPLDVLKDRFKWRELVEEFVGSIEFGTSLMRYFPALSDNLRIVEGLCEE